ncbi:MAG: hypothetical protein ABJQ93_11180, partial [Luteolibacter sp.]
MFGSLLLCLSGRRPTYYGGAEQPDFALHADDEPLPDIASTPVPTAGNTPTPSRTTAENTTVLSRTTAGGVRDHSGLPPIPAIYKASMPMETWAELPSHLRNNLVTGEAATRQACKVADAADAATEKAAIDTAFRAKLEAVSTTDDQCRSAVESTAAEVTHLRKQLDVAERAQATAIYTREKSRKTKAAVDRESLERMRSNKPSPPLPLPSPGISACPFNYTSTSVDFAFVHLPISTITRHAQTAFRPEHAKVVYTAGRSLLAFMDAFPMGTLNMVLTSPDASLPTMTMNM